MKAKNKVDNQSKTKSAALTVTTSGIIVMALILLGFTTPSTREEPEGLLVDFGFDETGMGKDEPTTQASAPQPAASTKAVAKEEIATQDIEEAIAIPKNKPKDNNPKITENNTKVKNTQQTQPQEKIDQTQVYDPSKYKFDGKGKSEGNTPGKGNMGKPDGDPNGYQGNGSGIGDNGTVGMGHDLAGRSLIKRDPDGNPQEPGKIVFNISVDKSGFIKSAEYERKGSTIIDQKVIAEARASLLNKKWFDAKTDASDVQQGHITISYTLQ